jgi:hypothetical protein
MTKMNTPLFGRNPPEAGTLSPKHLASSFLVVVAIALGGCGGGSKAAGDNGSVTRPSGGNGSSATGSSSQAGLSLSSPCSAWNSASQAAQEAFVANVRNSGSGALSLFSPSRLQSLLTTECGAINIPGGTLGTIVATLGG